MSGVGVVGGVGGEIRPRGHGREMVIYARTIPGTRSQTANTERAVSATATKTGEVRAADSGGPSGRRGRGGFITRNESALFGSGKVSFGNRSAMIFFRWISDRRGDAGSFKVIFQGLLDAARLIWYFCTFRGVGFGEFRRMKHGRRWE